MLNSFFSASPDKTMRFIRLAKASDDNFNLSDNCRIVAQPSGTVSTANSCSNFSAHAARPLLSPTTQRLFFALAMSCDSLFFHQ